MGAWDSPRASTLKELLSEQTNKCNNEHTHYPSTRHLGSIPSWKIFMQVFEQEDEEKHLLRVGKYGAWNISRPEQVNGEGWLVS